MRVLIVEDDKALGLFLQKGLKLEGHETARVEDGEAALEYVRLNNPDLIVLDLGLPGRDGMEVLEILRAESFDTAVLILTGRNILEERIRCFNLGADDCLLKPFSFHELAARCKAVLRRLRASADAKLRCGDLAMDLLNREVTLAGHRLELTAKEFGLLEYLLRHQGSCCSREELLKEVWQTNPANSTNVLDVYVNYLRKKLGSVFNEPKNDVAIETIRGTGYRIMNKAVTSKQQKTDVDTLSLLARGA